MQQEEYHKHRKEALEWWQELKIEAQVNFTNSWQKQLGVDFMKSWPFTAIKASDSAITRIWEWHQAIKAISVPKVDKDILTDKKY